MFDVLVCPLERFLSHPLVCGTVFHRTLLLPLSISIFCSRLKSHLLHFLIPLSDSSHLQCLCSDSSFWTLGLIAFTFNMLTFNGEFTKFGFHRLMMNATFHSHVRANFGKNRWRGSDQNNVWTVWYTRQN